MTIMAVAALAFAACEKDDTKPNSPDDSGNEVEQMTFEVNIDAVTKTTVTYSVTPSDLEADYFAVVLDATSVEACASDAEIIEMVYSDIRDYAAVVNTTFEAIMAEKVAKGKRESAVIDNLGVDTNYVLLLYGVDAEKDYAATSAVSRTPFRTAAPELGSCTFSISVDVNLNTAAIAVTPSVNTQEWGVVNVEVDTYNRYTAKDGEYQWTKEQFFEHHFKTQVDQLKAEGLSDDDIRTKLVHKGYRTLYASDLTPKTKYTCLVAGVSLDADGLWLSTDIKESRYNVGEAAESDLTFDIDVLNIGHYAADIRITPSNPDAEYYYYISYIDTPKKSMKPVEIANSAITEYIYYWDNYTELKRREPVKGVVDLTGDNRVELNIAETEYYIVAFSFEPNPNYGKLVNEETGEYDENPGTITSAPVYVSFMTAEQGDPMEAEFKFKASDIGPYDFTLEVEASDPTIYYQPGIAYADNFDPQAAINASASMLAQVMEMCMTGQSPSLTIQEALEEKCSHLYRNGDGKYYIANLEHEREYIGYVLVIDATTGKFVNCVYSDVIAKTIAPGSVTPKLELLGVYNGDQENGTIFGDADATTGRPIIAVKHTDVEGATALYCALTTDAYAEVNELSDKYIIAQFRGYWQSVNLTVPYHFFVATWDIEQTIVSYAQDANGHEAGVARLAVEPSEAGDIEELRGYVEEVNAATPAPHAMAKSLVVKESVEPTIECLWSEEVGAPRAAKVTYHAVEPLKRESDVVEVKVIKTFHF